jgi:hypothetical protein
MGTKARQLPEWKGNRVFAVQIRSDDTALLVREAENRAAQTRAARSFFVPGTGNVFNAELFAVLNRAL